MAFGNTITFTVNSVAKVLTLITQDGYGAEYLLRGTQDEWTAKIRHSSYTSKSTGKSIDRHNVELVQTVYPVSPATVPTIRKAYSVFENERADGLTEPLNFDIGFAGFLSPQNVTKLIAWES